MIGNDLHNPYKMLTRTGAEGSRGQEGWREKDFKAYSQPFGPKDYSRLQEGDRLSEWRKFYANDEMTNGDKIGFDGKYFEIKRVIDRGSFFNAEAVRVE